MALMEREKRVATRGRSMTRFSRRFSFNGPSWENEGFEGFGSIPAVPLLPSSHTQGSLPPPQSRTGARRWDGNSRITTDWDGLRRDPELWFGDGDFLVHLYSPGRSRRGPSFCLPLADIEARGCTALLELQSAPPSPKSGHSRSSSDSSIGSLSSIELSEGMQHVYLPAPGDLSKDEAFKFNVTTRNFFAWMFGLPVVGGHLGQSLIALLDRMNIYRPDRKKNVDDILIYMDDQGYTDFRECADHALAVLQFAEHVRIDELWGDAFSHCTGMNICLPSSAEYNHVSHISKTLIKRANNEMDRRLERAGHSLSNFFEDDLSATYLGLSNSARSHLEQFRSFLHTYYVGSYGYWPPARSLITNSAFPKSLYLSMYFEFRDLYLYLVDTDSSTSIQDNKLASGGLCVLQNVKAFDRRHRYKSLPHPLPIVPEIPKEIRTHSFGSSAVRRLGIGSRQSEFNRRVAVVRSLANATNKKIEIVTCPLVREYMLFERTCTLEDDEKVSAADARKVRWMLIYAIFQTLISVTQAPKEVKDTQDVSYSLCCQIPTISPWKIGVFDLQDHETQNQSSAKIDIQPDINYAASMSTTSLVSSSSKSLQSTKSKRSASPGSMRRMMSRAKHTSPTIQVSVPKRSPFCEILVHGYGNGLNPTNPQVSEADIIHGNEDIVERRPAREDSSPSTPSSSRDSSWSNAASSSSGESVLDMDHLSTEAPDMGSRQISSNTILSLNDLKAKLSPPLEDLKTLQ